MSGLDLRPGVVNYLLGNNSAKWIRNVPSYARVGVKNLYPGIDAVYYGSDGRLEIDFVLQAHINPALVRLRLGGGHRRAFIAKGDLMVRTHPGNFMLRRPRAYQYIGGGHCEIECRYVKRGRDEVAFATSNYDARTISGYS